MSRGITNFLNVWGELEELEELRELEELDKLDRNNLSWYHSRILFVSGLVSLIAIVYAVG